MARQMSRFKRKFIYDYIYIYFCNEKSADLFLESLLEHFAHDQYPKSIKIIWNICNFRGIGGTKSAPLLDRPPPTHPKRSRKWVETSFHGMVPMVFELVRFLKVQRAVTLFWFDEPIFSNRVRLYLKEPSH